MYMGAIQALVHCAIHVYAHTSDVTITLLPLVITVYPEIFMACIFYSQVWNQDFRG